MKVLALLIAIGLLKTANGIAWAAEHIADGAAWIIDQCDPKTRRRT
jgi:hypothetical protein